MNLPGRKKPTSKFGGKVRGANICPECGTMYIGKPEEKKNDTSGVRWLVFTHPHKLCRHFLPMEKKTDA